MPDHALAPARAVRRFAAIVAAMVAITLVSACDNASTGGVSTTRELINDVAAHLAGAESVTYTASYLLGTGTGGSIAHTATPVRTAYAYPGGKVIASGSEVTTCSAKPPCKVAPVADTGSPDTTLDDTLAAVGLVRPATVVTMLTTAALDANVIVREHDATYGGSTATCVSLSGDSNIRSFDACVTAGGLLGSFNGDVHGRHVVMTLDRFELSAEPDAFDVPKDDAVVNTSG